MPGDILGRSEKAPPRTPTPVTTNLASIRFNDGVERPGTAAELDSRFSYGDYSRRVRDTTGDSGR